jgi:hypothetical protein
MDNNTADPQPQTNCPTALQQQQKTVRLKGLLLMAVIALLMAGFGSGGFLLGRYLSSDTISSAPLASGKLSQEKWTKLPSNKKGFPVTGQNRNVFSYYSLDKAKAITVSSIKLAETSGASSGLGAAKPIASPDLYYTAYIGADNNLYLFSNETEQTKQLTKNSFVSYISG